MGKGGEERHAHLDVQVDGDCYGEDDAIASIDADLWITCASSRPCTANRIMIENGKPLMNMKPMSVHRMARL